VSLAAAKRLAPALSLRLLASKERSRRGMHASLGDRDPVQGAVELTVALAVEAMALLLAGGGIEREYPAGMGAAGFEPATSRV
jgi:hypothetical protein